MKISKVYPDGSQSIIYEPGDRVRLKRVDSRDLWIAKVGEVATVIRRDTPRGRVPLSIDRIEVQTDAMKAGGWGVLTVAPWHLELVAVTGSLQKNWAWSLVSAIGTAQGSVLGVDPRDALSRMLTSQAEGCRLLGEVHGIPVDVIDEAPGNADTVLEIRRDTFSIRLEVVAPMAAAA